MSKILANQIANYGDNSPVEVKEGVNIPAGKPIQASGAAGSSGQLLSSTGSSIAWIDAFDRDYNSLSNLPNIPAAQVNADWNAVGGIASILNKPVIPPQNSVTVVNASGSGNLSFNGANGEFTFTPTDLSSYTTSTQLSNAVANSSQWDAAYGWGNHASAGYATTSDVATAVGNSSNWDTAYGWGDHSVVGYLTSTTDTLQEVTARGGSTTEQIIANGGVRALNLTSGTVNDLEFKHDNNTSKSFISHTNTTDNFYVESVTSLYLNAGRDGDPGALYLQYNDSTKLSVTSAGVQVGDLYVSGTTDLTTGDLADVDLSVGPTDGQVLKWDDATSKWKAANDLQGSGAGLSLEDFSVTTLTAGTNALTYNPVNGVFSYTPPDLSNYDTAFGWGDHAQGGYLTSETDPVFSAHVASNILQTNINNWNSAYGWGNHASIGYLVASATDKANWNTAYGWGDHSNSGYLQAETDTFASVTGRGSSTSTALTITNAGTGLTLTGGNTTGRLDVQSAGAYAISLDALIGINTYDGVGLKIGNYGTNLWRAQIDGSSGDINAGSYVTTGSLTAGSMTVGGLTYPTTNGTQGYVLTSDGAGNVGWAASTGGGGGGGANVTIGDTAPGSPSFGDLWWESDKGRLKIYYNDTDSFQWVDASPPLSPTNLSNGDNLISTTGLDGSGFGVQNAIEFSTDNNGTAGMRWRITTAGHLLPADHETYDIGSAEYKVRHLFLSDNSLFTASGKSLSFSDGVLKWGDEPVITVEVLKQIISSCTSFGQFKEHIMGL